MLGTTLQGWMTKNKDALPRQEMLLGISLSFQRGGGGGGGVTVTCIVSKCGEMVARFLHMLSLENCEWFLLLVRLWPGGNLQ